jgi:drug/metabolite transporter (DMT)-like permease
VVALSATLFHVPVTRHQLVALALSYVGVLVVFGHDLSISGPHVVLGSLLVLGSAISYALYLVFSGSAVQRLGALRVVGIATSIACVLCIAQFFILRRPAAMAVAPEVIWLSVLNATLCTFLPVVLVMLAVERIGAPMTAQMGSLGPVSTILLSVLILGEPFTPWVAGGTALVLLGIWLLTRWKAQAPQTLDLEKAG